MYKKVLGLLPGLICLLFLCGCIGLEGTYYTSQPHSEKETVAPQTPGAEDITGYYSLKGALLNMVNMGVGEDILRIGSYSGNLDDDLKTIIQEITTAEPIGIYGVLSISAEQARVLSYREISVQIQYKRTASEMQAIISISGPYDLENRMSEMFMAFSEGEAYYIKDNSGHSSDIDNRLYATWMRCGARAVGLSGASASFYPKDGESCVVEITASYNHPAKQLDEMASFVEASAKSICEGMEGAGTREKIAFINSHLLEHITYDYSAQRVVNETGAKQPKTSIYTAYGVFSENVGAQSGIVLAASVMCDALGLDHTVETGLVNGDIYSWIAIGIDNTEYIFDVTAEQNGRSDYLVERAQAEDIYTVWQGDGR